MLRIENLIKTFGENQSLPLYERYTVVKDHLLRIKYPYAAAGFLGGNDHGPPAALPVPAPPAMVSVSPA